MREAEVQDAQHVLLQGQEHYRELVERHHALDDRLHELAGRHHLSASEQVEEVTIKKQKLAVKDQMEQLARTWARQAPSS
jgi:uncharacterized protein YdcH (DUF465 family)